MQRESNSGGRVCRRRRRGGLALAATLIALAICEQAAAAGLVSSSHAPIEERVAVAVGPERATVWVQLRVDGTAGPLALIVPAEVGAVVDWAAPSWMEALELATAPRILPPQDLVAACPGEAPGSDVVHVAGERYHQDPLLPVEVVELADAGAVALWAAGAGLAVEPELAAALGAIGSRFVAARFDAPDGPSRTPTLRLAGPGAAPVLPLVLSRGGDEPLKVTSWTIAAGRAELVGGIPERVDDGELSYDAASGQSDYADLLVDLLEAGGPQAYAPECASRQAFTGSLAVGGGHVVDGATQTYLERAALYSGGSLDLASCLTKVEAALAEPRPVAASCPPGAVGTVGGAIPCVEAVAPDEIDPGELRCGPALDDLAVALSGLVAADVVLSRNSLLVWPHSFGQERALNVTSGGSLSPIWTAETLDLSGCEGGQGGSGGSGPGTNFGGGMDGSGASGAGANGSSGKVREVPVYEVTGGSCGASDVGTVLYYVEVDDEDTTEAYYQETDDCSGDTTTSYDPGDSGSDGSGEAVDVSSDVSSDGSEDCGGDSGDGYDSGDDCSGDSGDGYDGGDDCGGDSGDGYGGDDCGGDSSGGSEGCDGGGDVGDTAGGCDGGDAGDCSVHQRRGRRIPRLSVLVMALLALAAPLRRWSRPRRRRRRRSVRA